MLVSDRPDLHVFMLRRTPRAVFGPGATVFPGGAVDASDEAPSDRIVGLDDVAAERRARAGGRRARAPRRRGARVLRGGRDPARRRRRADGAVPRPTRSQAWRDALERGPRDVRSRCSKREDLVVDVRELRVFSHWLTPVGAPRRYDTWFFVAPRPTARTACTTTASWSRRSGCGRPTRSRRHARGDLELILPTMRCLEALARFPTRRRVFAALDRVPRDDRAASARRRATPAASASRSRATTRRGRDAWTIPLPDIDIRDEARLAAEGVS